MRLVQKRLAAIENHQRNQLSSRVYAHSFPGTIPLFKRLKSLFCRQFQPPAGPTANNKSPSGASAPTVPLTAFDRPMTTADLTTADLRDHTLDE
jgi:hypothetical protein